MRDRPSPLRRRRHSRTRVRVQQSDRRFLSVRACDPAASTRVTPGHGVTARRPSTPLAAPHGPPHSGCSGLGRVGRRPIVCRTAAVLTVSPVLHRDRTMRQSISGDTPVRRPRGGRRLPSRDDRTGSSGPSAARGTSAAAAVAPSGRAAPVEAFRDPDVQRFHRAARVYTKRDPAAYHRATRTGQLAEPAAVGGHRPHRRPTPGLSRWILRRCGP
jgi:hypothetical protein